MEANTLVKVYIKMRDKREELLKEYEAQDKDIRSKMDQIEQALLEMCKDNGLESLRTENGTATRYIKERVSPANRDAFDDFVREHDALALYESRIHQGNFKEFMEAHPDLTPPVNIDRRYAIKVWRK